MTKKEQFYKNIRVEAAKKNISLSDLSVKMGASYTMLSTMKSKNTDPKLTTIIRIAEALDIPVEKLMKGL